MEKNLLFMSVDSEFENDEFLTLQILLESKEGRKLYVYYNSEHKELFETKKEGYLKSFRKSFRSFGNCTLPTFIPWNYDPKNLNVNSMIFYDLMERNNLIKEQEDLLGELNVLNLLEKKENLPENYLIQISFYYSLRDIYYLFSDFYISKYFTKSFGNTEFLTKKNSHFGKWNINTTPSTPRFSIVLHDFFGLSSSGYDNLLKMLDVKNPFKSSPLNLL